MATRTFLKATLTISLSLLILLSTSAQVNTTTVAPNSYSIAKDNIEYYIQTNKAVYDVREKVEMLYRVTNLGSEVVEFIFSYGPIDNTCDWMVNKDGFRIWDNLDRPVTWAGTSFNLDPSESYEYTHAWDMTDNSGDSISPGNYIVTGVLGYPSFNERYVPVSVSIGIIHEQKTYYVNPGESIQARIDDPNVLDGDTIIVYPGTYFENINFNGKNITLRSTEPNDPNVVAATIIDGFQNDSVVTFNSGEDANCVLNGFTITNGCAEFGGGIYCALPPGPHPPPPPPPPTPPPAILSEHSSQEVLSEPVLPGPVIKNCVINNNSADAGGGIYNKGSFVNQLRPVLINCTFNGNSASDFGGGIYNYFSSPVLTDCTFIDNSAVVGGGMRNQGNSISQPAPVLTNCTFNGNSASDFGGGMENHYSYTTLTNCTFNENSAGDWGGGMFNDQSSLNLTNCAFSRNSAYSGGGIGNEYSSSILTNCMFNGNSVVGSGGGMFDDRGSSTLINCTFTGNFADGFSRGGGGGMSNNYSYDVVINCIFWENMDWRGKDETAQIYFQPSIVEYSCIQGWTGMWGGTGNIGDDPCFVVPGHFSPEPNCVSIPFYPYCFYNWTDGDYHLLHDSPCVNAGDPNYTAEPDETDLDGNPRVSGGRIDMGAYEYIQPIQAEVSIIPNTINPENKGSWITCYIRLPQGSNVADIDPNTVFLEDQIQPEQFSVDEHKQVATARFSRQEVQAILDIGEIELTITGRLTDPNHFEGTDVIKVIHKASGKPDKYEQAGNPDPPDGATEVSRTADLRWTPGYNAASHDVYFGTANPPPFVCNQTATTFDPGTMDYETIYYWRIDEINKWGTTTGDIWSFITIPFPPPPPPPPSPPPPP